MSRDIHIMLYTDAPLGKSLNGITATNSIHPSEYIVALNADASDKQKTLAFLHEALHIYHNDFADSSRSVAEIEAERRAELQELLQLMVSEEAGAV